MFSLCPPPLQAANIESLQAKLQTEQHAREQLEQELAKMVGLSKVAEEASGYADKMQRELDAYKQAMEQAGNSQEDLMTMLQEREQVNKQDHDRLVAAEAALEKSVLAEAEAIEARNAAEHQRDSERSEFQKHRVETQQQIAELEFRLTEAMEVARQEAGQLAQVKQHLQFSSNAEMQATQQSVVMDAANRELANRIQMLEAELEKSKAKLKKVAHERERALQFYKESKAGEEESRKEVSKVRRDAKEMVGRAKTMVEAAEKREAALKEALDSINGNHQSEKARASRTQQAVALQFVKRAVTRALSARHGQGWRGWRENFHEAKRLEMESVQAKVLQHNEAQCERARQSSEQAEAEVRNLNQQLDNSQRQCKMVLEEIHMRLGALLVLVEPPPREEQSSEQQAWQASCTRLEGAIHELQSEIAMVKESRDAEVSCGKWWQMG